MGIRFWSGLLTEGGVILPLRTLGVLTAAGLGPMGQIPHSDALVGILGLKLDLNYYLHHISPSKIGQLHLINCCSKDHSGLCKNDPFILVLPKLVCGCFVRTPATIRLASAREVRKESAAQY